MSIVWIAIARDDEGTRTKAVDALVDSGCTILHSEETSLPLPGVMPKPSVWWRVAAILSTLGSTVAGFSWIWMDDGRWGWTSLILFFLAFAFTVIATPVKNKTGGY